MMPFAAHGRHPDGNCCQTLTRLPLLQALLLLLNHHRDGSSWPRLTLLLLLLVLPLALLLGLLRRHQMSHRMLTTPMRR